MPTSSYETLTRRFLTAMFPRIQRATIRRFMKIPTPTDETFDKARRQQHFHCGCCAAPIPHERTWFLKLYQVQVKGTEAYLFNVEYVCPECSSITTLRYATHDCSDFIQEFNLYTDTRSGEAVQSDAPDVGV